MELDLVGKTVTQSIALLREAVAAAAGAGITVKTDNETVKLNLYSQFHRLGLRCKAERKGPFHYLHLKSTKRAGYETGADAAPGVTTRTKEQTAFPIAHLGGDATAKAAPAPARRRSAEAAPAAAPRPTPAPAPVASPAARAPQPAVPVRPRRRLLDDSVAPTSAHAAAPEPLGPAAARACWLVVQHDQIGSRDTGLGVELMEDLLAGLDARRFAGAFLVHRGVRLLDPLYADGRLLRALVRLDINVTACERSVAFYGLTERISVPTAPFAEVMRLASVYELVWI